MHVPTMNPKCSISRDASSRYESLNTFLNFMHD